MAAKKTPKKQPGVMVSVRFPPELKRRLKVAAAHHGVTLEALIRKGAEMALGDL